MPDNILSDIGSELGTTVKQTVKQAVKTPLKILETGISQVSGQSQNTGSGIDEKGQGQNVSQVIKQMKTTDDANSQIQMNQIRQNLQSMMQAPAQPQQEVPKYISGKPGFSLEKIQEQNEEFEKEKKKLPDLSELLKKKGQGTAERFKGASG